MAKGQTSSYPGAPIRALKRAWFAIGTSEERFAGF